jgi:hypothetical protein
MRGKEIIPRVICGKMLWQEIYRYSLETDIMDDNKSLTTSHDDKEEMKTLSSCVNSLTRDGFEVQFKMTKAGLKSLSTEKLYKPDEVRILTFYRFEGESDPADNAILYAIETNTGERGTLTDAYGVYADEAISEFIKAVEEIQKKPHDQCDTCQIDEKKEKD